MTTLDEYLSADGAKKLTELAQQIGVSKGRLSQLRHSNDWPPDLALKVEDATDRSLDAGKLSPVIARARMTPDQALEAC